jgi:hypothetical protein
MVQFITQSLLSSIIKVRSIPFSPLSIVVGNKTVEGDIDPVLPTDKVWFSAYRYGIVNKIRIYGIGKPGLEEILPPVDTSCTQRGAQGACTSCPAEDGKCISICD